MNKYEDLIQAMKRKTRQLSKSRSEVIDFLFAAGICDKKGRVNSKFR